MATTSPNFFEQYNKPFLNQALKRGDDVALGTIPNSKDKVIDLKTGSLHGNFAKELDYLVRNNYKPVNVSPAQWGTTFAPLRSASSFRTRT